jgi:hypothetical protein
MDTEFGRRAQIALPEFFDSPDAPSAAPARALGFDRGSLCDPRSRVRSRLNKLTSGVGGRHLLGKPRCRCPPSPIISAQGLFPQSGGLRPKFERRPPPPRMT